MTNETLQTIRSRRSCRAYEPRQITDAELDAVLEAGTYAASAMGRQSAKIVVVQDAATRAQLTRMAAALRALGVENREHVLMVGDSLASDIQGGSNAGLDTCWYNPNHAENPGKVIPTYEIASLEELYPLVMEQEELANVGLKNRRHQC